NTPEVHMGGVILRKVDKEGRELEGAEFKIYPTREDALAGTNAITHPDGQKDSHDWTVISDTAGLVHFFGLAYGEYWIVETKAPIGEDGKPYNILKAPFPVIVDELSHEIGNMINVVNDKFDLPFTGGIGTLLFVLGGGGLVGTGVVFGIITRKNRENYNSDIQE
ncbi:MAG: SpaA isopeptide-forming pilin-related protein, partial [Oscillospiraceae bacterium]|nr:SpaA isopeptide-forming pilin-related protein [Oscillospiraceae bacterium]